MSVHLMRRARAIFEESLSYEDTARLRFVEAACGGDGELREVVGGLLRSDADGEDFLAEPLLRPAADGLEQLLGSPEEHTLGGYEILSRIGCGGTSRVYLAERLIGGARQRVAVKVVRRDLDDAILAQRVRTEAEVLSSFDHPNIARLLDAGTTGSGRPFFVLEYVDGLPLTEHCEVRDLELRDRLRLFAQVCEAVHYAHQRLVVHRDIKPRNVLVTDDGTPKLLDFGVAKLLDSGDEGADATASDARLMTPSYAAPEQYSGARVTTATDVYSLGVLLYELLTGCRPRDWRGLSPPEILQRWERESALPPSVVVSRGHGSAQGGQTESGDPQRDTRSRRERSPATLSRRLAGDLDTIVLRALRFEPAGRYPSVEQLADDLRRYLDGRPVRARPATRGYRFGKFLRRHAAAVTYGAVAVALLAGLSVVTTVQSVRLADERNTARRQRIEAEQERDRAETVRRFMIDAFEAADPAAGGDGDVTGRELVDRAVRRLEIDLAGQPETQAALEHSFGSLYLGLGMFDEAETLLERALTRRRALFGDEHATIASTLAELARVRAAGGDFGAAETTAREALAMRCRLLGPRHPAAATSLRQLASLLGETGRLEEAEARAREALSLHRESLGERHREVALDLSTLTEIRFKRGEMREAEATGRQALALSRQLFPDGSAPIADDLGNLGAVVWTLGRYDEAEALMGEALEMHRRRLGDDHPAVASDLNNLGNLRLEVGDTVGAEDRLRQALEVFDRRQSADHPVRARILGNLGLVLMADGRLDEAAEMFRRALRLHRERFGESHPDVASDLQHLGSALFLMGRHDEAERHLRRALEIRRRLFGDDAVSTAESWMVLARLARARGQLEEAVARYRHSLASFRSAKGADHWLVGLADLRLAETLKALGRLDEARVLADEGMAIYADALPPDHWRVAEGRGIVGGLLVEEGQFEEARNALRGSLDALEEAKGGGSVEVREILRSLARLYERWGRPEEAAIYRHRLSAAATPTGP